jgi:hypothetical protein
MNTFSLVITWARVAAVALLALFMPGYASAEICIDINWRFDERKPPPALVEGMKKEAASIWEPYGVWLQWGTTADRARCACTQASFDVLFDHRPAGRTRSFATVLGSTQLAIRAIEHVPVYIHREATEALLGSLTAEQRFRVLHRYSAGPADVGRALGRVLAHEVGHVLLAARDHEPRGLMRSMFSAEDLLTPRRDSYTLSPAEVTRLRQRERALNAIVSDQTRGWPVTSMARATADALRSSSACSVPRLSQTDPGS